jgi:hypothetical protein
VVILEEAAFMSEQVFWKVVYPLMGVDDTAVLAISTPDDEFNYYSELLALKLFREIYLGADCSTCMEAGVPCIHSKLLMPVWKSEGRQNRLQQMNKDKALHDRENLGKINSNKNYLFKKQWIDAFNKRASHHFQYNPQVIHCAIDPAGGGEGSDYTIGTAAIEAGRKVVINSLAQTCL